MPEAREQRVLVVKLSSLGDLFHALPAVTAVREAVPCRVDWVTNAAYTDLVRCFEGVARVIPFYRHAFLGTLPRFLAELRRTRYDLVLDLQGLLKSAMVCRLARARRVVGPSFHREGSRLLYSAVAGPRQAGRHAVEQALDTARFLGAAGGPPRFPVRFPAPASAPQHPAVALLPVSRWPTKNWPEEGWIALGRGLAGAGVEALPVLGGPADAPACNRIAAAIGGPAHSLAGRLSLPETGGLLAAVDLLAANDSGPVHIAAAVGTPCLTLFGPTDPQRTGPYGAGHRVLKTDLPCRPCFSRRCRIRTHACLRTLPPEQVLAAAVAMLGRERTTGRTD
jgi:lipopolysaccharide heptosyltransferase I